MDKWLKDTLPDKEPYHNRGRDQIRKRGVRNLSACDIVYHNRNICIPKIIVVFRTDLHKMKIKHRIIGEYATKRCFFRFKKFLKISFFF